jgi:hypothetical protein
MKGLAVCGSGAGGTTLIQHVRATGTNTRLTFEIHDLADSVRLFPFAGPASQTEYARGVFVGLFAAQTADSRIGFDQKRRQRNRLPARHAAHTSV